MLMETVAQKIGVVCMNLKWSKFSWKIGKIQRRIVVLNKVGFSYLLSLSFFVYYLVVYILNFKTFMKQLFCYLVITLTFVLFHQNNTQFTGNLLAQSPSIEIHHIDTPFLGNIEEVGIIESPYVSKHRDLESSKYRRFSLSNSSKFVLNGIEYVSDFKKSKLQILGYLWFTFFQTNYSKSQYVHLVGIVKNIN